MRGLLGHDDRRIVASHDTGGPTAGYAPETPLGRTRSIVQASGGAILGLDEDPLNGSTSNEHLQKVGRAQRRRGGHQQSRMPPPLQSNGQISSLLAAAFHQKQMLAQGGMNGTVMRNLPHVGTTRIAAGYLFRCPVRILERQRQLAM